MLCNEVTDKELNQKLVKSQLGKEPKLKTKRKTRQETESILVELFLFMDIDAKGKTV